MIFDVSFGKRLINDRNIFYHLTGGRYAVQYISKMRKGVICGDCHLSLPGVSSDLLH